MIILSSLVISLIECNNSKHWRIECWNTGLLDPCRCENDDKVNGKIATINCSDIASDAIDLRILSQRLEDVLFIGDIREYIVDKLVVRNTALKRISSNTFTTLSFKEIEIIDNKKLEFIDKTVFKGSVESLKSIRIVNNPKLFESERLQEDLWKLLNKFNNLRELELKGLPLTSIPSHAFKPKVGIQSNLRYVQITHNKIKTIGDYAFEGLTTASLRLHLSHNEIDRIGKNTLKFGKPTKTVIRSIDLSHNNLTEDSFDSESFVEMGRPVATLVLRDNNIKTLPESIFSPLFVRSDTHYFRLEVENNPIECNCSLQWIVKTKYCFNSERSSSVSQQISQIKCESDGLPVSDHHFSHCGQMSQTLSPSCLRSSLNTGFRVNTINNFYAINAINILILFRLIYYNFYYIIF